MGALNFITTTLDLRAKGMTLMRMPLTCWSWFITAILGLLAFGVLLSAGILLLMDRNLGTSFYVPLVVVNGQIMGHKGGSPLLWQHLFWFFGHPEVYIAILPGMGVASQVLSTFSRKPIFGYRAMVYAMLAIGFFGFMVWGHHMFMSGMSPYSAFAFSILTMCIGVPSAIKTFNWLGTMWKGKIRFHSPMLFAIGFVSLFVSGGLSGPFLAQPVLDIQLHDTYFVVGHFHLIMGVAAIFGIFAATYYWVPKMFGRMMNETWGRVHFFITLAGTYAIFMPMHYLGNGGTDAAILAVHRSGISGKVAAAADVHDLCGVHHDRGAVHLRHKSVLEHLKGTEGQRQSMGSDDPGVDDGDSATTRQFRWRDSGSTQRPIRVRSARSSEGLRDADRSGGCAGALSSESHISQHRRDVGHLRMRTPLRLHRICDATSDGH